MERTNPLFHEESSEMRRWLKRGTNAAQAAVEKLEDNDFEGMRNHLLESKRCLWWAEELSQRCKTKAKAAAERERAQGRS
jgi:hypothetical protein